MTQQEKKNKEIIKRLFSADENTVLQTIAEIRKSGNAALIPAIISQYRTTNSSIIRERIIRLLTDLKSQKATKPLVEEVFKINDPGIKRELIAACWQSGLDFSSFLKPFFDSLLTDEYAIALESFSVIENNLHMLEPTQLKKYKEILTSRITECATVTQPLVKQMEMIIRDALYS